MLNFKLSKLKNGLRVITAPLERTKAVTVMVLVGVGSRYEEPRLNGLAHFLEHMFFKGTTNRPNTVDIARDLDAIGASYNAFTGDEYTGFFVRASSEQFPLALDVINDMLFNSLFDKSELEKEKGVIVEEINMINDMPQAKIEYVAKELLWPDQPLGRSIAGQKETVTKFTREDFIDFKNKYYTPQNMVVIVAGGLNNCDWLEAVEEKFGKLTPMESVGFEKAISRQTKPQVKVEYKKTDQAHFVLGFRSFGRNDKDHETLKVLNTIMGANMSSRLFIEVRERRGLCYYVSTDLADYQDAGFWGAAAGVDINRIEQAISVVLEQFQKIKDEEVTDEELNRAKENLKGRLYLKLEESMSVADYLAEQELLEGEMKDPEELVKVYQKVTKKDIMKVAKRIFTRENLNLAVIGPFKKDAEDKFLKLLDSFSKRGNHGSK